MTIRVYNTLTQKKEEFGYEDKQINIYVCGVTPYSNTHLGHARPSVVWDVIKKYLRWQGFLPFHVQNFTDIDDKIIAKANAEGKTALEISQHYATDYLESMDALGVERADLYPKVSEHMDDIIAMIRQLVENGHAYAVNGNVFYDVASFRAYGKLSNQRLDELQMGSRFDVDADKFNAMDFALWKRAKTGEPAWDSPWGQGRPGWHIECSAMSHKYLGTGFHFHGGGSDLIFPHHENEIAQSEGATGEPSARYWLHNGMLNLKHEKMSKSQGNFVTIKDVLEKHPKELLRFYILSAHYRSELEYHDSKLAEVARGWRRLNQFVRNLANRVDGLEGLTDVEELSKAEQDVLVTVSAAQRHFTQAMDDDFNAALAIGSLFDLMREVNGYLAEADSSLASNYVLKQVFDLYKSLAGDILGIVDLDTKPQTEGLTQPLMELVLELRTQLRSEQNYALADIIRTRLTELGVVIEDTSAGTRWQIQND